MKWEKWELKEIDKAVENINTGSSIYFEVNRLWKGEILYRTFDSIRSKIGRGLKHGRTFKQIEVKSVSNKKIALVTSGNKLNFEFFSRYEYLFDSVVTKYYNELRLRFNMAPDLKHIVTKRMDTQLKKLMDIDKNLHDYSPGYAKLKAAEEKNIG